MTHFLFQKACHDIFIVRKNQFRKSFKTVIDFLKILPGTASFPNFDGEKI
jgi:hypothetical protein